MSRYKDAVRAIVERAGHLAQELRAQGLQDHIKPDGTPVTNADVAVSEFLTQELLAAFPDTRLISEEHADMSGVAHALTWAIDPIDGTKKYLAGKEVWCVMVGLFDTEAIFSMMYYPDLAVWYWAERGMGAWMEDEHGVHDIRLPEPEEPLRVAHAPGCVPEIGERSSHGYAKHARRIIWGKLDVFIRTDVGYWDLVPPMLLITEAGGVVTDLTGKPLSLTAVDAVAPVVVSGHTRAVATVLEQIAKR